MTTWAVSLLSSRLKTFQITWKASVNKSQCQIRTNLRSPADCHSVTPSLCFQTNKNYGFEAFYILYEDWNHWFQWFGLRKSVKSAKGDISTVSTRHQSNSNPWNQSRRNHDSCELSIQSWRRHPMPNLKFDFIPIPKRRLFFSEFRLIVRQNRSHSISLGPTERSSPGHRWVQMHKISSKVNNVIYQ